ncbi:acyl carrier protein [Streptomyces sp. NPDC059224]|uniref:acyl carrier protein n=1 Tax=Streptomyces sp. NPDC059224 TaxID=3346775 RepID=UPI00369E8AF7
MSTAELVLTTVAEVTGCGPVRPDDSFFDIGGSSLDALRICLRINRWAGTDVDHQALLDSDDLAAFVVAVDAARAAR